MTTATAERTSIYERITSQIVQAIEVGAAEYRMPWHSQGADSVLPVNAVTHKPYRGINTLCLWAQAAEKGYASNVWATFNQWKDLGANVRKGEKATLIVFWKFWTALGRVGTDYSRGGRMVPVTLHERPTC